MQNIIKYNGMEYNVHVALYTVEDFMGKKMPGLALVAKAVTAEDYDEIFLTVSLGEYISFKDTAYVDINNLPAEIIAQIEENGWGKDIGLSKLSGFVQYPLWLFDHKWLKEIGGAAYAEYEAAVDNYMLY